VKQVYILKKRSSTSKEIVAISDLPPHQFKQGQERVIVVFVKSVMHDRN
jgi:hypothetical protein